MADANPSTGPAAVLAQLRQLWGRLPRRRRARAIGIAAAVIAAVVLVNVATRREDWAAVAELASPEDAQELVVALGGGDVEARLRDGKVWVRADQLSRARAITAAAGLPRTGTGLELFDKSTLGRSSFAEQVNYRRALQGELARSITALAQVAGARVHLALGRRSVWKDQEEAASASVALHLHPGQALTDEQVRGVRKLVASSVEGLKPDAVVVVDSHGNLLDAAEAGPADRQAELERTLAARVRAMLERVVGVGRVSVVATATVDDRKVSETQEVYDAASPAVRSESRVVEGAAEGANVGGIAGARGNLPGAAAGPLPMGAAEGARRVQETRNYELSRTVRQTSKPDVQLQRLHVAVVLDYKDGPGGIPAPRTTEELGELTALARQAAGIDDARGDRIEVRSIPFAPDAGAAAETPGAAAPLPLGYLALGGGVLLAPIAAVMLRRRRGQAQASPPLPLALPARLAELERVLEARPGLSREPGDPAAAAAMLGAAEPPKLPPGRPVHERVLEAVRADTARAAEVLTAWLSEQPAPPPPPLRGGKP